MNPALGLEAGGSPGRDKTAKHPSQRPDHDEAATARRPAAGRWPATDERASRAVTPGPCPSRAFALHYAAPETGEALPPIQAGH